MAGRQTQWQSPRTKRPRSIDARSNGRRPSPTRVARTCARAAAARAPRRSPPRSTRGSRDTAGSRRRRRRRRQKKRSRTPKGGNPSPKLASAPMSRSVFYVLFAASGFAGLIYESVWTHYLKLFLGHAAYAQSLVLAVFMGGMAAGAAYCGRISPRLANPLLGYALVEAVIGVLALFFHELFVALTDWSYSALLPALGGEWRALAAKMTLSCLLILPQSVLLGMTFPLMSAGLVRARPSASGESIAMLYFTN